jgi:ATP-binding cassette subfamily C protein CydD
MATAEQESGKAVAKAWLRRESRQGSRTARPVVLFGLAGTALAIGQAYSAAFVLGAALDHGAANVAPALAAFAMLALLRAALAVAADRAAFDAGAAARRRLRSDALSRLLHAGPALLRAQHSGELTSVVVDRIEALDGLFARWLPASTLAVAGPVLVALAALLADRFAGLVLILCGLLVPVAMAAAGIGAAAASRSQFLALARLQARFLDRVRGIATIVLYGQADAEVLSLAAAADELRRRTMRVLRVAFLSSAALDLAAALAFVVLALRYGMALLAGRLAHPETALFILLLVPEFFAPLRGFAAAYQRRNRCATCAPSRRAG